jgi:predicted phosphoribosyltransferase
MLIEPFRNRAQAGALLAHRLESLAGGAIVVLALPRGGVPVAFPVAQRLHAPLDILPVRKVGLPWHEEFAIGAVAAGGVRVVTANVAECAGVNQAEIERLVLRALAQVEQSDAAWREVCPPQPLVGRTAVLVDDGMATGCTMRAALSAVRARGAARVIVAVPVASPDACEVLRTEADEVVCMVSREPFLAVGAWYRDFTQVTDAEVRALLRQAGRSRPSGP